MRWILIAGLLFGTVAHAAEDATEVAYLRAWYLLKVENQPEAASKTFETLLKSKGLSEERRLMCRLGVAECKSRSGHKNDALQLLRQLQRDAARTPQVLDRVIKAIVHIGRGAHGDTFRFHYKQGFNFKRGEVVDVTEADVVFSSCAGGISSIVLTAPGGIMNLEKILGRRETGLSAAQLFDAVAAAPGQLKLENKADGDSRAPESDVFILRTRDGGWAKLGIVNRGSEGGWTKYLATVRYSYNPDEPWFAELEKAREVIDGVAFTREPVATDADRAAQRAKEAERRARLMREAARAVKRGQGGGEIPDASKTQEVLLSRRKFKDYEKCTFSFRFGIRDDLGLIRTRNNWDLQYGNGRDTLQVRMVTDDLSTITDLGESTWEALAKRQETKEGTEARVHADYRHVYLVRTEDTDGLYFSFVRVAAIRPGVACWIQWVSLQDGELRTSPGLKLGAEAEASLERLLEAQRKRAAEG